VTAHVGTTVGEWVRTIPETLNLIIAAALALGLALAAIRFGRSKHTAAPNPGPYTSDSWPNTEAEPEGDPYGYLRARGAANFNRNTEDTK
jgi:hypothetical protein